MAVEPLQYFISFAYADDTKLLGEKHGWVTHFVDTLQKEFSRLTGETRGVGFSYFYSPENQDNSSIPEFLIDQIQRSKIFIALVSPTYMKRPYCRLEIDEFVKAHSKRPLFGRSIFVVALNEDWYPAGNEPPCFEKKLRHQFWRVDDETRRGARICHPVPDRNLSDWELYNRRVTELAEGMRGVANEYWGVTTTGQVRGSAGMFSKRRSEIIFVDGAPEDRDLVTKTAEQLQHLGYPQVLVAPFEKIITRPRPGPSAAANLDRCDTLVLVRKRGPGHLVSRRITGALKVFAQRESAPDSARPAGYGRVIVVDAGRERKVQDSQGASVLYEPNGDGGRCAKRVSEELRP